MSDDLIQKLSNNFVENPIRLHRNVGEQELSIQNGWGDKYMELAKKFDIYFLNWKNEESQIK